MLRQKHGNKRKNRPSVFSWLKRKRMSPKTGDKSTPKSWYQAECPVHGRLKSSMQQPHHTCNRSVV